MQHKQVHVHVKLLHMQLPRHTNFQPPFLLLLLLRVCCGYANAAGQQMHGLRSPEQQHPLLSFPAQPSLAHLTGAPSGVV
jgi:hypothetical protein